MTQSVYRPGTDDEFPGLEIVETSLGEGLHLLLRKKTICRLVFKFVKKNF